MFGAQNSSEKWMSAVMLTLIVGSTGIVGFLVYERSDGASQPAIPGWAVAGDEDAATSRSSLEVAETPCEFEVTPIANSVSNEEMAAVVSAMQPYFDPDGLAGKTPVGVLTHSLRLWGPNAQFPVRVFGEKMLPGLDSSLMIKSLFNHTEFLRNCSIGSPALLMRSEYGIHALSNRDSVHFGSELQAHVGQLIAMASEIGLPASFEVTTGSDSTGTIEEIVRDTAVRATRTGELEWITIALARYAQPGSIEWRNRFDQTVSFDALTEQLCDRPIGDGACGGTHIPYALTIMIRADAEKQLLSESTRDRARYYLQRLSKGLEDAQTKDGAWDFTWPGHVPGGVSLLVPEEYRDALLQNYVITGHQLEWMALAPGDLRPSAESMRRAARYLITHWDYFARERLAREWHVYNPTTHAARALWLVSGIPKTDQDSEGITELIQKSRQRLESAELGDEQ